MVSDIQKIAAVIKRPRNIALMAMSLSVGALFGWQMQTSLANQAFEQHLSSVRLDIADAVNKSATRAFNQIDSGFEPSSDLASFVANVDDDLRYTDAQVVLGTGLYFGLDRGNPHQGYLATTDDSDHAATPLSQQNTAWWRYYFQGTRSGDWAAWFDPDDYATLFLVFPLAPRLDDDQVLLLALPTRNLFPDFDAARLTPFNANQPLYLSGDPSQSDSLRALTLSLQSTNVFNSAAAVSLLGACFLGLVTGLFLWVHYQRNFNSETERMQRYFEEVSGDLNIMVFETNQEGLITWSKGSINSNIQLFNVQVGDSLKRHLESHPRYLTYWQQSLGGERITFEVDEGDHALRIHQWPRHAPNITGTCALIQDITEARLIESELRHQQFHDPLTGLPNRQLFMEHLHFQMQRSKKRQEFLAVLAIEVSGMGKINEAYGHSVSDILLKKFSENVRKLIHDDDTFSRFSNDEFLICCNDYRRPEELQSIAESLITEARKTHTVETHLVNLSANIGIATYPRDARDPGSLVSSAITAMQHARETGRNTLDYFSQSNARLAHEKWQLEQNLKNAVHTHDFELHYQPIFELTSNECVAAEALIRWPSEGTPPNSFIPLAEETGLIDILGLWVIETALEQFCVWRDHGYKMHYLSLNLSVKQLANDSFFRKVEALVHKYPFTPGEIVLEITESVMMETESAVISKLNRLKKYGFNLAIDDFGTGFSSLSYLRHLPVDILKVDRSFVSGLNSFEEDAVICEAIVSMATAMGLEIVAEGVETPQQLKWLTEQRVAFAQGYFYAKPVPASDFEVYLKAPR